MRGENMNPIFSSLRGVPFAHTMRICPEARTKHCDISPTICATTEHLSKLRRDQPFDTPEQKDDDGGYHQIPRGKQQQRLIG